MANLDPAPRPFNVEIDSWELPAVQGGGWGAFWKRQPAVLMWAETEADLHQAMTYFADWAAKTAEEYAQHGGPIEGSVMNCRLAQRAGNLFCRWPQISGFVVICATPAALDDWLVAWLSLAEGQPIAAHGMHVFRNPISLN